MGALHHLAVWSRACDFTVASLEAIRDIPDQTLNRQVSRALLAIPARIAAGHEQAASAIERKRHLRSACGYCLAARTHLHIAQRLSYLEDGDANRLIRESIDVADQIVGLLQYYDTRIEA